MPQLTSVLHLMSEFLGETQWSIGSKQSFPEQLRPSQSNNNPLVNFQARNMFNGGLYLKSVETQELHRAGGCIHVCLCMSPHQGAQDCSRS